MNDILALQNRTIRFWFDTVQASADAMTTVAMRLPLMAASQLSGEGPTREDKRMVSEKVDAAMEGALDSALAGGDLLRRAMFGQLNPALFAHGMVAIADAAHRPARRRVKANALRLTGG